MHHAHSPYGDHAHAWMDYVDEYARDVDAAVRRVIVAVLFCALILGASLAVLVTRAHAGTCAEDGALAPRPYPHGALTCVHLGR